MPIQHAEGGNTIDWTGFWMVKDDIRCFRANRSLIFVSEESVWKCPPDAIMTSCARHRKAGRNRESFCECAGESIIKFMHFENRIFTLFFVLECWNQSQGNPAKVKTWNVSPSATPIQIEAEISPP